MKSYCFNWKLSSLTIPLKTSNTYPQIVGTQQNRRLKFFMEPKRHMLICSNSLRFLDESSYKAVLSELVTYIIVWIYNSIGLIVNNRPLSIKLGKVSLKWRIIIMRSQVCTRNCISPEISVKLNRIYVINWNYLAFFN